MSSFLLYIRTAWNDYFTSTNTTQLNSQTFFSKQTPSGTGVYISNCLFSSIRSSDAGGALYCTSVIYFLVEFSSFISCKTSSSNYGAIYFYNGGGQSVLHGVCGYNCCTTGGYNYQFGYIEVKNDASSKNYVNYSSIVRCVNENSGSWYMFGLQNGKTFCPSDNISMNKCGYYSGTLCWPTTDSNSFAYSLRYSSFTDNNAIVYVCIFIWRDNSKFEIKNCNILRNTQGSLDSEGTFRINGNLKIDGSCILENTATRMFYQYSSSYTITFSNCTVDKTTCNQNVVTKDIVTKSFILALKHISTQNCHSQYDSVGYLTPIVQTPSSTKKRINCYTYVKCFNQSRLRDFFSLLSVFIFNVVHPYDSFYP
jgi:hypothetical protein